MKSMRGRICDFCHVGGLVPFFPMIRIWWEPVRYAMRRSSRALMMQASDLRPEWVRGPMMRTRLPPIRAKPPMRASAA